MFHIFCRRGPSLLFRRRPKKSLTRWSLKTKIWKKFLQRQDRTTTQRWVCVHVHYIREGKPDIIMRSLFVFALIVGIRPASWYKVFKNQHNREFEKWAKSFGRLSNFAGSREGNELPRVCGETKREQNKGARIRGTFLLSPNRLSVGRAFPNLTKKIRATTKFYSLLTSGLVAQMV